MFDKLKKLFVLEDGSSSTPSADTGSKAEADSPSVNSTTQYSKGAEIKIEADASNGTPDQKFIDILLKAIDSNNMEGYDYLEYKQALQSLASLPMDDATRYNSALAMAKTMGADKGKILSSAGNYLGVLKTEEEKFKAALTAQKTKIEQNQTTGISNLENNIAQKQQQVENLLKQIEEDKAKLAQTKGEIEDSSSKLQVTANNFMSAYNLVVNQIVVDVDNIKKFAN